MIAPQGLEIGERPLKRRCPERDYTPILLSSNNNTSFRLTPPGNLLHKYCDPASRGYLAHPDLLQQERIVTAQKYGYEPPVYDENDELFKKTKVIYLLFTLYRLRF